jgi:hypothetical protein
LARSRFSPPDARRRAAAAARGPAEPTPPRTPWLPALQFTPPALPVTASPTGPPGLPGRAAPGTAAGQGSLRAGRCCGVSPPWATPLCPRWASHPARVWWCRCAGAADGVPVAGPVAAAPADGRRAHTWSGSAVHAGIRNPGGVVRPSRRPAGLAAEHLPARPRCRRWYPDRPGLLQVPPWITPPAAQPRAPADKAGRTAGCPWAKRHRLGLVESVAGRGQPAYESAAARGQLGHRVARRVGDPDVRAVEDDGLGLRELV